MPKEKENKLSVFNIEEDVVPARGWYLVCEEEEPTGSIMSLPDESKDQAQFALVIAVGGAIIKDGQLIEPDASVGDLVYFEKWKGLELERGRGKEKKKYKLIEYARLAGIVTINKKKGT